MSQRLHRLLIRRCWSGVRSAVTRRDDSRLGSIFSSQGVLFLGGFSIDGIIEVHARGIAQNNVPVHQKRNL